MVPQGRVQRTLFLPAGSFIGPCKGLCSPQDGICAVALLACVVGVAGCTPKNDATKTETATPKPSASATPLPIAATVSGVQATLFDKTGGIVAKISAKEGAMGTGGANGIVRPEGLGLLKGGEATLYQKGKPSAVMMADTMRADQQAKTVVGVGNVRVRSLQKNAQNNASAIRADTMTWRHDTSVITGSGNVVITNGPEIQVPGDAFEADTSLRTFRLTSGNVSGDAPKPTATGKF